MVVLLLIAVASAEPSAVTGEVAARMEAGTATSPGDRLGGVALSLGGRLNDQPYDLTGYLALSGGTVWPALDGRLQGRWWVATPAQGPSLVADYGVRHVPGAWGQMGSLGFSWDTPLPVPDARHRIRVTAAAQFEGIRPDGGVLHLGWAWGPEPEPPPPPPPPPPEPEPEPEPDLLPEGTRIWLPHPVCRWITEDDLDEVLASLPNDQRAHIHAKARAALFTDLSGVEGAQLQPAAVQGALLVVGQPGDRVQVGERVVSAGLDGVVEFTVAEGVVDAEVVGGGRRTRVSSAITPGHGTWVRVDKPVPIAISFEQGSAEISPEARERLAGLVADAGGWRFELQGGFSPEGNRAANVDLATRRSEAVHTMLLELGLSSNQVSVIPAAVPEDASDAAARRVCTIHPRPAGGEAP